ncbi:MAG: hypothetical protein KAI47_08755, partial [Deltaproteobacteria bacterium]|nr:hypothetical protein [Deltaproteobacteria bacterium]
RSPRFEAAYIAKRAEIFALSTADVAKLREVAQKGRQDDFTFVVIAATYDLAWNDFDQNDSRWRLSLVNDRGDQVAPRKIARRRRITETDVAFFPQLGKLFHQRYDVRFPRLLPNGSPLVTPETRSLTLRAAGALGKIELVWKLKAEAPNLAISPRSKSKPAPPATSSP